MSPKLYYKGRFVRGKQKKKAGITELRRVLERGGGDGMKGFYIHSLSRVSVVYFVNDKRPRGVCLKHAPRNFSDV